LGIGIGFAALALQATLVPHVRIAGIGPDLPLIATLVLAYRRGATGGTLAGFIIGLGQDLTNPAFLGLNALVKSLLGFTAGSARDALDATSAPLAAAVLLTAKLAHDLVYLLVFTHLSLTDVFAGLFAHSLPAAVYTVVLGTGILAFLGSGRRGGALDRPGYARR
jgi:rod shape-determining protein MreD